LNGNPQAIIIVAPILGDSENPIELSELYKMLVNGNIDSNLEKRNLQVESSMMQSLQISACISI
jgi:hypothetical protein